MSQPRELYQFTSASGSYYFTSADTPQTYLGQVYACVPIGRTEINLDGSVGNASIDVSFDMGNWFAQAWLQSQTDNILSITIFSIDNDTGLVRVIWKGRLTQVKPDMVAITMSFESIYSSLKNAGLRACYQLQCRHALYGRGCGLTMSAFATAASVTAISGSVLTVPVAGTHADGTFTGGIVQAPDTTLHYIMSHVGTQLTLIRANTGFSGTLPLSVTLYLGCDRTKETCKDVFNNVANHGGFPWSPTVNPFGGTPIV